MKKVKIIILLFISLFFMFSCITSGQYLEQSFANARKSVKAYKLDKNLYKVMVLRNVKVIIVGHRGRFAWDKASAFGSPVMGYATNKNVICLFGYKDKNGKIILNQTILGHELQHLLNFKDNSILNPDKLKYY